MVSVIIPNYNHASFLRERIDSVLNQSYQDFEVIILDDNSTDDSRTIINTYKNHPKVTKIIFNSENSGSTFKQWQKGFELANGEYIWIAESDDVAHPDFLKRLVAEVTKNEDIVMGFSSMIRIDENSKDLGPIRLFTRGPNPMAGKDFVKKNMLFGCHILNASSAIFKKESLNLIPKDFLQYTASGDYQFWIDIAQTGKVVKINEGLDYFRHHSNKVTPRAVASGLQFQEVNSIISNLVRGKIINRLTYIIISGFWQRKIRKCKIFSSKEIQTYSKELWETKSLPSFLSELMYLIYGGWRFIIRKIQNEKS